MRKISNIIFFSLSITCTLTLSSQEIVTGLKDNPVAYQYYTEEKIIKKNALVSDTLELPFIDDFSDSEVEPKQTLWADNHAFINKTYATYPPTVGVATLDALDFDGSHYPEAGPNPYQADYLTSQPLNLDFLLSDSIYLSFYYQPGGLAEPPETRDSLILDFYSVDNLSWNKIWSVPGIGASGSFKRVMIRIDKPEYLKKGFQFRFRNYASQLANTGRADMRVNADHWHIDYVRIDKNRFATDTILRDVSFSEPVKSLLKEYSSLPWPHFKDAYNTQRAAFVDVVFQNHDSIPRNVGTYLEIRDLINSKPVYKISPLKNDLPSGDSIHYKYSYNYLFNFDAPDLGVFEIKTILQTDLFDYKANDTLRHIQEFYDFYALDDGTAEASYGMRGSGTKDASSALKFFSYTGDSLRAVDIYFVQALDSVNLDYYFYLNVWSDNGGKPGTKLVNQIGMRPEYTDKLNKFVRYNLDTPVYLKGAFYIGFTQTVEYLLNVGLDLNTGNKLKIFNNADNGIWKTTEVLPPSTPMMRPVFRQKANPVSVTSPTSPQINAFPNPADNIIRISFNSAFPESDNIWIEISDISGRVVKKLLAEHQTDIETGDLPEGLYFLRISNAFSGQTISSKIIINH